MSNKLVKYVATNQDFDNLYQLLLDGKEQMKLNNSEQWSAKYPNKDIIRKDIKLNRLSIYGKPIMACVTLYIDETSLMVERFIVSSKYAGEGIGKKVMKDIISLAKENKLVDNIIIVTSDKNIRMKRLLNYYGFNEINFFKKYERSTNEFFIKYQLMV